MDKEFSSGHPSSSSNPGDKGAVSPPVRLIVEESLGDDSSTDSEGANDAPPESLRSLVNRYVQQEVESDLMAANRIALNQLGSICLGEHYSGDSYDADLRALGRARRYLKTLELPYQDIEIILKNARAMAQARKAPGVGRTGCLNTLGASSLMYIATFFLGKWLTAATGIGLVFTGPSGSAALAALVNAFVVPLTQAVTGDPMGAALRNFGPSVASEDSRQYAAFMTAHALYMRAHISGAPSALKSQFAMEMDRAINTVVWREKGNPGTVKEKPLFISSGVDPVIDPNKPKAEVDEALRGSPYTKTQRFKVVAAMLARILVSDELPVHTFSLFNGVTGCLNLLWPALFGVSANGQAIARAIDAAAHTSAGFMAMYFMFLLQDWIRPAVQGVGPIDPTNEEYLEDKTAPYQIEVALADSRLSSALLVLNGLETLKGRLKAALRANDQPNEVAWERLNTLLTQCRDLCKSCKHLRADVTRQKALAKEDIRALTTASGAISRMVLDTCRVMSGRSGRTAGPSWTDGSPSVVRGLSKYLAYASALMPATVVSIVTSRAMGESLENAKVMAARAASNATAVAGGNASAAQALYAGTHAAFVSPENVTLSYKQITEALQPHIVASGTTALWAILGWNARNTLLDPAYQHIMHAGIGLVERVKACCCAPISPTHAPQDGAEAVIRVPLDGVVGTDPLGSERSGADAEVDTKLESEDLSRSQSKGDSDSVSGEESGTSSVHTFETETFQSNQFVQDLQRTAQELTTLSSNVFGDVGGTEDLEKALQEIVSLGSVTSITDQPQ